KPGGQHGGAATAQHQPERPKKLGGNPPRHVDTHRLPPRALASITRMSVACVIKPGGSRLDGAGPRLQPRLTASRSVRPHHRDGAVVGGVVVSAGSTLGPLTPGTAGVVTAAPGTPGIATLVPAALVAPGTVAAAPGTAAGVPDTVVAAPGIVAVVPGTPGIFPVTSFAPRTIVVTPRAPRPIVMAPCAPGTEVVTPCAPGTDAAAPAAPGTAPVVAPGTEGVICDFAPSRRIFSPSFTTFCARACEHAAATQMAAIVQEIARF